MRSLFSKQYFKIIIMKNAKLNKVNKEFGLKIKIERIRRGITQDELAYNAKINRNTLGNIERGENSPSFSTIYMIAKALNIKLKNLMDFDI